MVEKSTPWYWRFLKNSLSEMWQRWLPLWHLVFFALLAISTILLIMWENMGAYSPLQWFFILLSFTGWYSLSIRYKPSYWREQTWRMGLYLATGWFIWWLMVSGSSIYFIVLTGLFPHLFIYQTFRNAIIAAVILNMLVLLQLALQFPAYISTWMVIVLMTSTGGIVLGYFIDDIINQSRERRRLIETLDKTREQLAKVERLAGISEERQRVAAELHDTLVQSLISVVTHLEAAENSPEQAENHLQTAKQAARDSLQDARQAIQDLRPLTYDKDTFPGAIRQVCQQWRTRSDMSIEFTRGGNPLQLSDEVQHALLRILQEALANISRHAHASQVFVTLKFSGEYVKLIISDDGHGFDVANHSNRGQGIENMRHRAQALNGILQIESETGQGTTIRAELAVKGIEGREHYAN